MATQIFANVLRLNNCFFRYELLEPVYRIPTKHSVAALALTLAKNHPNMSLEKSLVSISRKISRLLAEYPSQKFHLMVESFLKRMARTSSQTQAEGTAPPALTLAQAHDENFTGTTNVASLEFPGHQSLNVQQSVAFSELDGTGLFSPPDSFQEKELEAILGLPAESWFLDPFSVEGFNFDCA